MNEPFVEREQELDAFAIRQDEARASLRTWLRVNPSYTYQSFIERLPEPTDKSTVSIWLSGRLSAATSRKARMLMEAAEELMVAPTGDKTIVEDRYDCEPIDDDQRYLMNLVHELRALSRTLCERFPVRLVQMAGKYAVPARNLIRRDRTAGCGNVLSYMLDGMEYATAENISESALRLAHERSVMLRDAGLDAMDAYNGSDRAFARAKFLNYDGALRARVGLVLGDESIFDAAMHDLLRSLDEPSRSVDGVHVNIVEVLEAALARGFACAERWADRVLQRADQEQRHQRMFGHALAQRALSHLHTQWSRRLPVDAEQERMT